MNEIPNCVSEYFREQEEREIYECELEQKRMDYYEKNSYYRKRKYIDGCNELSFYPCECIKCVHGEEAMPDSEYDDFPTMICSNWKNCQVYRREIKEAFSTTSWEEYVKWTEEYVEKLKKEDI